MAYGARLKEFAENKYGSVSKLSQFIGVAYPQLNRYANDKVEPGADVLEKLSKAGCDINWLLTGKEQPDSDNSIATGNDNNNSGIQNNTGDSPHVINAAPWTGPQGHIGPVKSNEIPEFENLRKEIQSKDVLIASLQKQVETLEKLVSMLEERGKQ